MARKLDQNRRAEMQEILNGTDIDSLLAIVTKLDRETRNIVLDAISKKLDNKGKTAALNRIKTQVRASDTEIKDWLVTAVVHSYAEGGNNMLRDIETLRIAVGNSRAGRLKWSPDTIRQIELLAVHKDAVNALVSDAYLDFANGMNGIVKGAEHQLNDAVKRQIRAQNIAGTITGSDIRQTAKAVEETIGQQGFSVLVDRGGRQWTLEAYATMLVRTHIIKAANEGAINRASENGVDLVQISTHPNACKICQPFEGKIYSISGENETYPVLSDTPPFHPHCRHTILPRPFLTDLDE